MRKVLLAAGVLLIHAASAQETQNQDAIQATELAADERIVIDGKVDDSAWQRSRQYSLAHKYSPSAIATEIPNTTYRVMVDREFLYIAIECSDPNPERIWKMLARRDVVRNADFVTIWIDPQGARKFAQVFRVAAGGAIRDGTFYEESGRLDEAPDFAFESATHMSEVGWSAELKIPASSLRISRESKPTILVSRFYPRSNNFVFASTDIDDRHQCMLCKNPTLTGLGNMQRGRALTVTPYVSVTRETGDVGDATLGRAGVDLKWRLNDSAVADITAWPDFSQVELDTPQLSANSTYALFYPEKRPFFLEGLDLFDTPMRAVYTRTLTKPTWGARITHRGDGSDAALLAADDSGGGTVLLPGPWSTDVADQPQSIAAIARSRFHLGAVHAGVIAAMKDYGADGNNIVGGADAVYSTKSNRYNAQVLLSSTTALAGPDGLAKSDAQSDSAGYLGWKHDSDLWHTRVFVERVGDDFRDDSGFIEASGLYSGEFFAGRILKPILGLTDVMLYGVVVRKQTLAGETITTDFLPGIEVEAGSTHVELLALPVTQQRTTPQGPLHRMSSAELIVVAAPAKWLPGLELVADVGDRLDTLSDRVGTGYQVRLAPTFLVRSRLRIGAVLAQEFIAGDAQTGSERTLLRDSIAELNASYFFNPINELRGTYQHHETYRDPTAFTEPVTENYGSDLVSLVYTWSPSLGKAFYAGGTWSNVADVTHTAGAELFVKMTWAF
jgi:hypothetical protein